MTTVSQAFLVSVQAPPSVPTKIVQQNLTPNGATVFNSIQAAIGAAVAGDLIEVRANSAGGTQQFSEGLAFENKHFASLVTLRARFGDTIRVDQPPSVSRTAADATVYARTCLFIKASSRIRFEGRWIFGTDTDWSQSTAGNVRNRDQSLLITDGSHHLWFGDGTQRITFYGGSRWTGNLISQTCYLLKFERCDFTLHGTNHDEYNASNAGSDWGDLFNNGCYQVVMADCTFSLGGHEPISSTGHKQVYRRCTFSGDWRGKGTGFPGSRSAAFIQGWSLSRRAPQGARPSDNGPVLVDGCSFKLAGQSVDGYGNDHFKIENGHTILRHCDVTDNQVSGGEAAIETYALDNGSDHALLNWSHVYSYNNTAFNTHGMVVSLPSNYPAPPNAEDLSHWHYRNNLYASLHHSFKATDWSGAAYRPVFRRTLGAISNGSFSNGWKGSEIAHNLFQYVGQSGYDTVEFQSNSGGSATVPLDDSAQWPAHWHDNRRKAIGFVDVGTFGSRTREGLALDAASKLDADFAAVELTKTTGSGSNTPNVPVANARFFYDGWGMSELGETGDVIDVGGQQATIISIDYATGVITVGSPISFASGASVRLVRDGAPVAYKGAMQA